MKKALFLFFFSFAILPAFAHGEHDTVKNQKNEVKGIQQDSTSHQSGETQYDEDEKGIFAPFSEFPNLHPLVVHFPVVFLLLGFFTQLFSLFVFRKQLSIVTIVILLLGFVGAFLAANTFHPHPEGLEGKAYEVLETHELFASWTFWTSLVLLILKIISHFALKMRLWAEIIVLLFAAVPAITVSLTGHLGTQLVYLEGVGPEGKNVEEGHTPDNVTE